MCFVIKNSENISEFFILGCGQSPRYEITQVGVNGLYEEPYAGKPHVRFCEGRRTSSHYNRKEVSLVVYSTEWI